MKECVKRLWNTLKTTFLNIKLQRLCKSHHLQCKTGEISVRKWQGWRPLLDARGLRALRRHSINHRHDSVIDITNWAQEYFQKPLSVNTIRRAICRCQLKLYHAKRKPYVNMVQKRRRVLWAKAHLKWTVSKWKGVLWSDESKFDTGWYSAGVPAGPILRRVDPLHPKGLRGGHCGLPRPSWWPVSGQTPPSYTFPPRCAEAEASGQRILC